MSVNLAPTMEPHRAAAAQPSNFAAPGLGGSLGTAGVAAGYAADGIKRASQGFIAAVQKNPASIQVAAIVLGSIMSISSIFALLNVFQLVVDLGGLHPYFYLSNLFTSCFGFMTIALESPDIAILDRFKQRIFDAAAILKSRYGRAAFYLYIGINEWGIYASSSTTTGGLLSLGVWCGIGYCVLAGAVVASKFVSREPTTGAQGLLGQQEQLE